MDHIDICVVGLGYIGLPTASLLATRGHRVHGVDVNQKVVDTINNGDAHFQEPDLDEVVKSVVASGALRASTTPVEADIFIIAVPTPFTENRDADLSYIKAAAVAIAPCLKEGTLVVLESTSPVGTTHQLTDILLAERPELVDNGEPKIHVAHCPERVLPGRILVELLENDRIVGGINDESTQRVVEFYKTFVSGAVLPSDAKTAELSKLAENSFRDVNIAFANELSIIADKLGANVWEVIKLANRHPRVNILRPGAGVGGHCIAVDPWFIVASAPEEAKLIRTAREVNDGKMEWSLARVLERAKRFRNPVVACLGLAYKPDVDDFRESPALQIAQRLTKELDGTTLCVEPNIGEIPGLELVTLEHALKEADILVALVSHRQFKRIDPELLKDKIVLDLCGVFK